MSERFESIASIAWPLLFVLIGAWLIFQARAKRTEPGLRGETELMDGAAEPGMRKQTQESEEKSP